VKRERKRFSNLFIFEQIVIEYRLNPDHLDNYGPITPTYGIRSIACKHDRKLFSIYYEAVNRYILFISLSFTYTIIYH
jgi:hypothetical protein